MEKCETGQFKGKKLDEMNLDLKEDLLQTGTNEEIEERLEQTSEHASIVEEVRGSEEGKKHHWNTHKNRKKVLAPWTDEHKKLCPVISKHILRENQSAKTDRM
ncbi:hypothetical protein Trydic_g16606 [Trypoxylus dichotomus]